MTARTKFSASLMLIHRLIKYRMRRKPFNFNWYEEIRLFQCSRLINSRENNKKFAPSTKTNTLRIKKYTINIIFRKIYLTY